MILKKEHECIYIIFKKESKMESKYQSWIVSIFYNFIYLFLCITPSIEESSPMLKLWNGAWVVNVSSKTNSDVGKKQKIYQKLRKTKYKNKSGVIIVIPVQILAPPAVAVAAETFQTPWETVFHPFLHLHHSIHFDCCSAGSGAWHASSLGQVAAKSTMKKSAYLEKK